ncbi:MAG: oxidoreductase domain protein [Herbinix sp.]|jgi:predicted dehydrogenase|nr:oxidoreductase domain protein [Herbinix sp.]
MQLCACDQRLQTLEKGRGIKMIRIGIVGTGDTIGIAKLHINAFKLIEEATISALYDYLPERADKYKDEFKLDEAKVCVSYEELLEHSDAVIICTPNFTHDDLIVRALNAGKHVLCEKPFGNNAKECEAGLRLSKVTDKICMLGLCYRNIPAMRYIKKMIDDGTLGEIYYIRQSQGGNRIAAPEVKLEWRMQEDLSGPGAIADFGSHMLDLADMLTSEKSGKITEVSCMEHTFIDNRQVIGKEMYGPVTNGDVAVFHAKTEKGTLLSFTASRIGAHHTLDIYGSGGSVIFRGEKPFEITFLKKEINGAYEKEAETLQVPKELYMEDDKVPEVPFLINFYLQGKEFVDAISGKRESGSGFEHGIYIQKLIDALQESAKTGKMLKVD